MHGGENILFTKELPRPFGCLGPNLFVAQQQGLWAAARLVNREVGNAITSWHVLKKTPSWQRLRLSIGTSSLSSQIMIPPKLFRYDSFREIKQVKIQWDDFSFVTSTDASYIYFCHCVNPNT